MLGRLRMSVDECISRYPEMSRSIFGTKKPLSFGGLMKDKYPATNLKNVIEDIVFEHLPEQKQTDECLQMKSPEDLCKTCVLLTGILAHVIEYSKEELTGTQRRCSQAGSQ